MKKILFFIILFLSSSFGAVCSQMTPEELEELREHETLHPQSGLKCSNGNGYTGFYYRGVAENDVVLGIRVSVPMAYCACLDERKNKKTLMIELPKSLVNYNIMTEIYYDEYGLATSKKEKHTKSECTDLYKSCKNILK